MKFFCAVSECCRQPPDFGVLWIFSPVPTAAMALAQHRPALQVQAANRSLQESTAFSGTNPFAG